MADPRTHAAGEEFSDREKPLGKIQSVEDTPLGIEFTWKPDGCALVVGDEPADLALLQPVGQRLGWDTWGDEALGHVDLGA